MNRLRSSPAPLSYRNFRLLFFGRFVSFAGSAMAPVALAFAVLDLGGSATDLGLVLALAILPQVVFLLVGGVIACAGIVFVAITAQLLSHQVRELPGRHEPSGGAGSTRPSARGS